MDGCVAAIGDTVGNGVSLAIEFNALGLIFELIAEQAKQRSDPLLSSFGGGRGIWPERFQLALEDAPVVLRVRPGTGDFVFYLGASVEAEISRTLAGGIVKMVENVRREDGTFDADAGVNHAAPSFNEASRFRPLSVMR